MKTIRMLILVTILMPWYSGAQDQKISVDKVDLQIDRICDLRTMVKCDFSAVLKDIGNASLVLLGEYNHGAGELFSLRNQLIQQLHEDKGFDVVLFEAGIAELLYIGSRKELTADELTYGFFGIWRNREFEDLMHWLDQEQIPFAGFDVQRSGSGFQTVILEQLGERDTTGYGDIENRFGRVQSMLRNRDATPDTLDLLVRELIGSYSKLMDKLNRADCDLSCRMTNRAIENRIGFLRYMLEFKKDNNWSKRWFTRDSIMADNIRWLRENVYPDQKMIVIAHNFHAGRYNEKETVMGELLLETYPDLYSLGMFGGSGSYANNSGEAVHATPPDSGRLDIKHLIEQIEGYANFLSMKDRQNTEQLDRPVVVNDSFIDLYGSDTMILPKTFDGVLLLREVSPPTR